MTYIYDCIIVGAGPAGSTLAANLANAGLDVLLLDKSTFPRYKVCGGGVTKRAIRKMPIDITSVIRDEVHTFVITNGSKVKHTIKHQNPFVYMVMRDELDQLLANHAIKCGVTFKTGEFVRTVKEYAEGITVKTRSKTYLGKFLVGADGVNSPIATQVGLMTNRNKSLALEHEILCSQDMLAYFKNKLIIDYQNVPHGYLWIFPKGNHLSIGVGSNTCKYVEMATILQSFIDSYNMEGEIVSAKGAFLSAGGKKQKVITQRTALIGDAAGLVDSLTGEGIYYALWSAELLANQLIEIHKNRSESLNPYQKDIDTIILPELQALDRLRRRFYKAPRASGFIITHSKKLLSHAFAVIEGNRRYLGYLNRQS